MSEEHSSLVAPAGLLQRVRNISQRKAIKH